MITLAALPEYWSKAHEAKSRAQKAIATYHSRRPCITASGENCEKNRPRLRHADLHLEGRQGRGRETLNVKYKRSDRNTHVIVSRDRGYGRNAVKSVEDLDVFKLAHQLTLRTYAVTSKFPKDETFSLVNQMRRAAASVGMNLMEGSMRLGSKEYRQFVGIARGSAGEVCYQLLLAKGLKYITEDIHRELRSGWDRVLQMLSRLSQTLGDDSR
jgi:four helix bundle protein